MRNVRIAKFFDNYFVMRTNYRVCRIDGKKFRACLISVPCGAKIFNRLLCGGSQMNGIMKPEETKTLYDLLENAGRLFGEKIFLKKCQPQSHRL